MKRLFMGEAYCLTGCGIQFEIGRCFYTVATMKLIFLRQDNRIVRI
ncbi:MAG: hypothetical protein LBJ00_02930 [Planctomycetaceae bacterium]|nr:hypothetical protein [Planctomycetaceae bacterium]